MADATLSGFNCSPVPTWAADPFEAERASLCAFTVWLHRPDSDLCWQAAKWLGICPLRLGKDREGGRRSSTRAASTQRSWPFERFKVRALCKDRPHRACHLVGQRHDRNVVVSSFEKSSDPARPFCSCNHGSGASDQQRAQIGVLTLGEAKLLGLATGANLARRQSDPRRKLAARLECREVPDRGHQS